VLITGEPEPTDIAVAADGTLYWTCKSAGVINRRTRDGVLTTIIRGLDDPTGIALDRVGNLYWTEVPTPGVPGDMGGMNRVIRYDLDSGDMVVIDEGDPEPTDITVTGNGRVVAWTCTSAGVIVAAREVE